MRGHGVNVFDVREVHIDSDEAVSTSQGHRCVGRNVSARESGDFTGHVKDGQVTTQMEMDFEAIGLT